MGGVALVLWGIHFRFLWAYRTRILIGVALVCAYALPMEVFALSNHWGGFNPVYVLGITFFGGMIYLEEIVFWAGTSLVTISAVFIFAELEERGVPWWALPAGILLPVDWLASAF